MKKDAKDKVRKRKNSYDEDDDDFNLNVMQGYGNNDEEVNKMTADCTAGSPEDSGSTSNDILKKKS